MTDESLKRRLWSAHDSNDEQTFLDFAPGRQAVVAGPRHIAESQQFIGNGRRGRLIHPAGDPPKRKVTQAIPWLYKRLRDGALVPDLYGAPLATDADSAWTAAPQPKLAWVGHATFFLETHRYQIITDPVWSDKIGTFRRLVPPGLHIRETRRECIVVISHNHRDHLDIPTLRQIVAITGGTARFFIPIGMGSWFRKRGFRNVTEFDWWEHIRLDSELDITFVPSRHWSMRMPWDKNRSLWGGWWIEAEGLKLHFCGDTAFDTIYTEMRDRLGEPDVGLLPIGAYAPRQMLQHHHIDPTEASEIYQMLGAKTCVPFHWGTFVLADEPVDEPPELLQKAWRDRALPRDHLALLHIGQTLELGS